MPDIHGKRIDAERLESVLEDARLSISNTDRGFGAFHAAGYARGAIETLRHLGVLSAKEFGQLEHKVMIAEADADVDASFGEDLYD
ncbi:hypothetical protein N5D52_20835 [Pseudomonas sp. GD03860]|uniref:hypothetical protein n=1 Tax=Pseudomonas TaxID=286 RepID=UPI0023632BE3|nr:MULTISPECIES: hypothetical protein [Pseudomonas]MDD2059042.1 hypothetical protein [Pseudomonas putida]MDH0639381.1 hypothetical protein [Pseudomonas sp. GD03860]